MSSNDVCREQFVISQSTPEYEKLLSLIPGEFVGTSTRLRPLVKLLCMEMEQAFQDTGLTWPPWRQVESMMSKWLPSKVSIQALPYLWNTPHSIIVWHRENLGNAAPQLEGTHSLGLLMSHVQPAKFCPQALGHYHKACRDSPASSRCWVAACSPRTCK